MTHKANETLIRNSSPVEGKSETEMNAVAGKKGGSPIKERKEVQGNGKALWTE